MRSRSQAPRFEKKAMIKISKISKINKATDNKLKKVEKNLKEEKGNIVVKEELIKENKNSGKELLVGIDFCCMFPDAEFARTNYFISQHLTRESIVSKDIVSETDCPPSPPDYDLNEVFDEADALHTPNFKCVIESGTQTSQKDLSFSARNYVRKSARIAKIKLEKSKLDYKSYSAKKMKFN